MTKFLRHTHFLKFCFLLLFVSLSLLLYLQLVEIKNDALVYGSKTEIVEDVLKTKNEKLENVITNHTQYFLNWKLKHTFSVYRC